MKNCCIMMFRSRTLACFMLAVLLFSMMPAISFAQQTTATISAMNGSVLVNGQSAAKGAMLRAGDVIETQAGASVVLELSDGSQLELSENTQLDLAVLTQSAAGGRVSRIKLAWGWVRAKLTPGDPASGSRFEVESPNALVGVKFSEGGWGYDPKKQEMIAIAYVSDQQGRHLRTGELFVVPEGSSARITPTEVMIISGLLAFGAGAAKLGSSISTNTLLIAGGGAGAAIAAVTLLGNGGSGDSGGPFAGTWVYQVTDVRYTLEIGQNGNSLSGDYTFEYYYGCSETKTGRFSGSVLDGEAWLDFQEGNVVDCQGYQRTYTPDGFECYLPQYRTPTTQSDYILCDDGKPFYRQ